MAGQNSGSGSTGNSDCASGGGGLRRDGVNSRIPNSNTLYAQAAVSTSYKRGCLNVQMNRNNLSHRETSNVFKRPTNTSAQSFCSIFSPSACPTGTGSGPISSSNHCGSSGGGFRGVMTGCNFSACGLPCLPDTAGLTTNAMVTASLTNASAAAAAASMVAFVSAASDAAIPGGVSGNPNGISASGMACRTTESVCGQAGPIGMASQLLGEDNWPLGLTDVGLGSCTPRGVGMLFGTEEGGKVLFFIAA
ncbi:unnamed protein product [Protopolystoma xenopodis]|uniref:Uncharacterized protein n=1 Tax=Protopolystoma xenopodis TaxID=117903 RepID=A0A448WFZ8_9PLAT|nr:unnamed protein product [Protopolystoma xenopodis]